MYPGQTTRCSGKALGLVHHGWRSLKSGLEPWKPGAHVGLQSWVSLQIHLWFLPGPRDSVDLWGSSHHCFEAATIGGMFSVKCTHDPLAQYKKKQKPWLSIGTINFRVLSYIGGMMMGVHLQDSYWNKYPRFKQFGSIPIWVISIKQQPTSVS